MVSRNYRTRYSDSSDDDGSLLYPSSSEWSSSSLDSESDDDSTTDDYAENPYSIDSHALVHRLRLFVMTLAEFQTEFYYRGNSLELMFYTRALRNRQILTAIRDRKNDDKYKYSHNSSRPNKKDKGTKKKGAKRQRDTEGGEGGDSSSSVMASLLALEKDALAGTAREAFIQGTPLAELFPSLHNPSSADARDDPSSQWVVQVPGKSTGRSGKNRNGHGRNNKKDSNDDKEGGIAITLVSGGTLLHNCTSPTTIQLLLEKIRCETLAEDDKKSTASPAAGRGGNKRGGGRSESASASFSSSPSPLTLHDYLNAADSNGDTPLHIHAMHTPHREVSKKTRTSKTASAAKNATMHNDGGVKEIIDLLLSYGADVNARNKAGLTPLMVCGTPEAGAALLTSPSIDVGAESPNGNTALLLAMGEFGSDNDPRHYGMDGEDNYDCNGKPTINIYKLAHRVTQFHAKTFFLTVGFGRLEIARILLPKMSRDHFNHRAPTFGNLNLIEFALSAYCPFDRESNEIGEKMRKYLLANCLHMLPPAEAARIEAVVAVEDAIQAKDVKKLEVLVFGKNNKRSDDFATTTAPSVNNERRTPIIDVNQRPTGARQYSFLSQCLAKARVVKTDDDDAGAATREQRWQQRIEALENKKCIEMAAILLEAGANTNGHITPDNFAGATSYTGNGVADTNPFAVRFPPNHHRAPIVRAIEANLVDGVRLLVDAYGLDIKGNDALTFERQPLSFPQHSPQQEQEQQPVGIPAPIDADPDAPIGGMSYLLMAATTPLRCPQMIDLLLSYGCSPNPVPRVRLPSSRVHARVRMGEVTNVRNLNRVDTHGRYTVGSLEDMPTLSPVEALRFAFNQDFNEETDDSENDELDEDDFSDEDAFERAEEERRERFERYAQRVRRWYPAAMRLVGQCTEHPLVVGSSFLNETLLKMGLGGGKSTNSGADGGYAAALSPPLPLSSSSSSSSASASPYLYDDPSFVRVDGLLIPPLVAQCYAMGDLQGVQKDTVESLRCMLDAGFDINVRAHLVYRSPCEEALYAVGGGREGELHDDDDEDDDNKLIIGGRSSCLGTSKQQEHALAMTNVTPLMMALHRAYTAEHAGSAAVMPIAYGPAMVAALLNEGADVAAVDGNGRNAIDRIEALIMTGKRVLEGKPVDDDIRTNDLRRVLQRHNEATNNAPMRRGNHRMSLDEGNFFEFCMRYITLVAAISPTHYMVAEAMKHATCPLHSPEATRKDREAYRVARPREVMEAIAALEHAHRARRRGLVSMYDYSEEEADDVLPSTGGERFNNVDEEGDRLRALQRSLNLNGRPVNWYDELLQKEIFSDDDDDYYYDSDSDDDSFISDEDYN